MQTGQTPLENMQTLHTWLTTWEKHVNTEKRTRDDKSVPIGPTDPGETKRKRVSVPAKQTPINTKPQM